jgi:coenzyme F420-reducing hydrogenase beta subunit
MVVVSVKNKKDFLMKKENNITNMSIKCCGCGACYNICPVAAISMNEDKYGFLYPMVSDERCINCGNCIRVCPIYKDNKNQNTTSPKCYALMASNEIREKSSSGGMFSLISEYVLKNGGYVFGVAYDKDFSAHTILIDNVENLWKLRGSKYFQSRKEECYKTAQNLLKKGKLVLFTGTPCEIAGLKSFLGSYYENLLTVELLCHGAPSYKIFRKYLDEHYSFLDIKRVDFRDKSLKWRSDYLTIEEISGNIIHENIESNSYELAFHRGLFNRESCAPCKFAKLPRVADFTIADWWGISKIDKSLDDTLGTSLVLLNNKRSEEIFHRISDKAYKIKEIPLYLAKSSVNKTIYKALNHHTERSKFFNNFNDLTLDKNVRMCIENKYDICLLTTFFGDNYGSMLVSYAVNKILRNLGYSVLMLQKPRFLWNDNFYFGIPQDFANKHYNVSRIYESITDLRHLNNHCNTFVSGSDQLFKPWLNMDYTFLPFVDENKNKIAFCTSFGDDEYNATAERLDKNKYLLSRFNALSLRECGDNLCNNIFQIKPQEFIDPSLMLPIEEYIKLAETVNLEISEKYILTYMLDSSEEKENAIKYLAEKMNLEIINIDNLCPRQKRSKLNCYKDCTPEEFLYLYKNASFVITDSYHGTCFSVKFNKPFISFINNLRGGLRYKLFNKLGITAHLVENVNDIYNDEIFDKLISNIDYSNINLQIQQESDRAITWLKDKIDNSKPIEYTQTQIANSISFLQKENWELENKILNLNEILLNKNKDVENEFTKITKYKYQNIFSVKNEYKNNVKHKVITILGIKMKFRVSKRNKKG